jgi:anti-sigma B factor antagonist
MTAPSDQGWTALRLDGEIDLSRQEELEDLILAHCNDRASDVIIDLSKVTFMDSTGLSWLARTQALLADFDCRMVVVVPAALGRIFEVTGLLNSFDILESEKAGVGTPHDNLENTASTARGSGIAG